MTNDDRSDASIPNTAARAGLWTPEDEEDGGILKDGKTFRVPMYMKNSLQRSVMHQQMCDSAACGSSADRGPECGAIQGRSPSRVIAAA